MRINSRKTDSLGYRIIVLDDDIAIVDSLCTLLRKSGFDIMGLTDPVEAIEKISAGKFDMLILDYMMDKMNGDKVVEFIREFNKELYILLLTGHKDLVPPLETLKSLEIQGYCEKSDKIDQLILLIESGIKSISQMNAIKKLKDEMNDTLKQMVAQQNLEIKNLLNNAGQGVLTFSKDLVIDPVFSQECIKIFGKNIEFSYFPDLLYPNDEEQRKLLSVVLTKTFEISNAFRREVYLSILPKNVELNDKYINIEYKLINSPLNDGGEKFMLIITDITEKRFLENRIEQEKAILEMVVRAVADYDVFTGIVNDFKYFCASKMYEILESNQPLKDVIYEIYRTMHNFKGGFGQLRMVNIVKLIQEFENEVSSILKDLGNTNINEFKSFIFSNNIHLWLDKDLSIIKATLGEDFINRGEFITVSTQKINELKKQMQERLPEAEFEYVSTLLKQLQHKPFHTLFKTYPDYVTNLAEQCGKPIKEFEVHGGEFHVDIESYRSFTNSLIHIFRNIIDHGIETPEERTTGGKDECGTVDCTISKDDSVITIVIADDGKGINFDQVKEKAFRAGLFESFGDRQPEKEALMDILFCQGFTTKDTANMLSGRGMGLSVVKTEIEKLGGTIKLETKANIGTRFIFTLPILEK